MLTIKILFTINSLKKTIPSKHYLKFLSLRKKHSVLIRKNSFDYKKLFELKTFHFNYNNPFRLKKLFSGSIAFLISKSKKRKIK